MKQASSGFDFGMTAEGLRGRFNSFEKTFILFYFIYLLGANQKEHTCYQFRVPRNLRIDIKDRLEEYSQSIELNSFNNWPLFIHLLA